MLIERFTIQNFKGIKDTRIDIGAGPPGNIITLIGLNESGKTTILEALANFGAADAETRSFVGTIQELQSPESFVPKARRGIFSGSISIEVDVVVQQSDIEAVTAGPLGPDKITIDPSDIPERIQIERRMTFEGGDLKDDRHFWSNFQLKGRKGKGTKLHPVTADKNRPAWLELVSKIRERIPRITYFPTFLFTFPERIYLRPPSDWDEDSEASIVNRYYNRLLQDVADSIKDPDDPKQRISIESQVVKRLENAKEPTGNPFAFWSWFSSQKGEYDKVRAVLNLIAQQMGDTIFPAWNKIFDKPTSGKRVEITFGTEPERDNLPWVQISIFDGQSTYALHERSLGFRWFFSFLLFTQFRKERDIRSIFLFDEPAANLHSAAQQRLMEGFVGIVSDGSFIVYSTHSHYLVNPLWLEKAYIIKNSAVDYDADLDVASGKILPTDISATNYRAFVNANPSKVSYFQPALDALRFNLGPMTPFEKAAIVEGKFDFHPIEYFRRKFTPATRFNVFPVNGAGDAAPLIKLFRGWGVSYVVVVDDDAARERARKKYMKELGVPEIRVLKLGELNKTLEGQQFEAIYGPEVDALASMFAPKGEVTKRAYFDFFLDRTSRGILDEKLGRADKLGKALVATIGSKLDQLGTH